MEIEDEEGAAPTIEDDATKEDILQAAIIDA
jgi:hypothetical protein